MKKSLIVSAMLVACASTAFAQSSVNLSGTVDVGVENSGSNRSSSGFSGGGLNAGPWAVYSDQRTGVVSSRNKQSQITFGGQEDLGGGLKATFKISTQFNADDGSSNSIGNNESYVGLEGSAGKLRLGRSYDPVYSHALTANDRFGVSGYQTLGTALNDNGIRVSNQISYISPSFHGLTGTLSHGSAEGNQGSGAQNAQGFGLRYVRGPIEATLASSRQAGMDTKFVHQVGAAYDFGPARVLFTAQEDRNTTWFGNTGKHAYALGVTAPVGPGVLWASYDVKDFANQDNGQVAQVGYKYSLSKRTVVYGQVGAKNSAFTGNSSKGAGLGITHSF